MHISWEYIETFLAVAEELSFSGAAKKLEVTQPTVSRRIGALEETLGRTLFERDAEGSRLTEDGAKLLPAASQMSRHADELGRMAADFTERIEGVVSIAAPPLWARIFLVPLSRRLHESYPDVQLSLVGERADSRIAVGDPPLALLDHAPTQQEMTVLLHAEVSQALFALPDSPCAHPESLPEVLVVSPPRQWEHVQPNRALLRHVPQWNPTLTAEDPLVRWSALEEGLGATLLPQLFLESCPFQRLAVEIDFPPVELYLVCSESLRWIPRVRAVALEVKRALERMVGINLLFSLAEAK